MDTGTMETTTMDTGTMETTTMDTGTIETGARSDSIPLGCGGCYRDNHHRGSR